MSKALKILSAVVSGERKTRCESCGDEFACKVSLRGCWCAEIELTDAARTELRAKYSDCLCRSCLEKAAATDQT